MLRVVLDTVVFVRSLINPFSNCGRIVFTHTGRYRLFVSQAVVQEIFEVLNRPELRRKFRSVAGLDSHRLLELLGEAELVDVNEPASISRDPNDDKFLATAAAAEADYLVTEDADMLVVEQHAGVSIVDAAGFLRLLEARP
jgi:uncharacterized protein